MPPASRVRRFAPPMRAKRFRTSSSSFRINIDSSFLNCDDDACDADKPLALTKIDGHLYSVGARRRISHDDVVGQAASRC